MPLLNYQYFILLRSTALNQVYGNEHLDPVAFKIYTEDRKFMHNLGVVFAIVITLFLPLYNIANCELLEEFEIVKRFVKFNDPENPNSDEKSRPKLLLFRLLIFVITISFALLTDKVEVVLNFSGAIFVPLISFYMPVLANIGTWRLLGTKVSAWRYVHEYAILLLAAGMQVFSLRYSIWCQILGNAC